MNSRVVRGNNSGIWIGELEANAQYSVGLWSTDGVANDYAVRLELMPGARPEP